MESLPAEEIAALEPGVEAARRKLLDVSDWPLPPNLPPMATIVPGPDGGPPIIMDADMRLFCPHCGKRYMVTGAYHRHLLYQHGWRRGPDDELLPPEPGDNRQERRAA